MKDKLEIIINNYGVSHQLKKLSEEVFEFQEAVLDYENAYFNAKYDKDSVNKTFMDHLIEEYADILVILGQFKAFYSIDDKCVEEVAKAKINRQIERISKE